MHSQYIHIGLLTQTQQERIGVFKIFSHSSIFFRFFSFSKEDSIQIDLLGSNYSSVGRIQYKSTLCLYILRNFDFGVQNDRRTNTRYAILDRRYFLILLIFNSKQCHDVSYIVCKFEENRSKNTTVRVPQRFYTKWPP